MYPQIQIEEQLHTFRAESQLKSEAKGGYIRGKILLSEETIGKDFNLALYDMHGNPHTNLLFVTPSVRQPYGKNESNKDLGISPASYYISVIWNNGTYIIDHNNHPYLTSFAQKNESIVGSQFWNPQTKEILLGPNGLKLTILKPLMKGSNSKITDSEMRTRRDITKSYNLDNTKVKLGLTISDNGHEKLYFANALIEDAAEYNLVMEDSSTKAICNNGFFILKVDLKKGRLTRARISRLDMLLIEAKPSIPRDRWLWIEEYLSLPINLTIIKYKYSQKEIQFCIQTNPVYKYKNDLSIQLEVHYKDGTKKIFTKEKYIKISDHIQDSCHCYDHRESVEGFNLKHLKEPSIILKRKFPDDVEENDDFAESVLAKSISSDSMVNWEDIEPSLKPSSIKIFDDQLKKEIINLEKALPTCITIDVAGKKQTKLCINMDGSVSVEHLKDGYDRKKIAKLDKPTYIGESSTPQLNEVNSTPSKRFIQVPVFLEEEDTPVIHYLEAEVVDSEKSFPRSRHNVTLQRPKVGDRDCSLESENQIDNGSSQNFFTLKDCVYVFLFLMLYHFYFKIT